MVKNMLTALLTKKQAREMSKRLIEKQSAKRRERLAKLIYETPSEE